jgi:hypothetical protein
LSIRIGRYHPIKKEYAMSADNGVYILVSRGPKKRRGYTKEYRVAHAQAIDNIFFEPDYPRGNGETWLNRKCVLRLFGNARVFTDRRLAEGYAQRIYDEHAEGYSAPEYGIEILDCCAHLRFPVNPEARDPDLRRTSVG